MQPNQLKMRLIDCGSSKVPQIASMVQDSCAGLEIIKLAEANRADWKRVDALIISGGPHLFTDPEQGPVLRGQFEFISDLAAPALGICLGHQALGLAGGANVFRGEECRRSISIELLQDHPLLQGLKNPTDFGEDHTEGIDLPPGYTRLGRSAWYGVEIMAHDGLRRYGVQFHPEISGGQGEILLNNFISLAAEAA